MTVNRHDDVLDSRDVLHEVADATTELVGKRVTRGVGDVDDRRPRLDDRLDDAGEKPVVRTPRVFGVKLDVLDEALGVGDRVNRAFDALLLGDAKFVARCVGSRRARCEYAVASPS